MTTTKRTSKTRPTTIIPSEFILEENDEQQEPEDNNHLHGVDKELLEKFLAGASSENSEKEEEEIKDLFSVVCKDLDNSYIKEVHLPKFLMTGTKVGEKGNMFIVFEGDSSVYSNLLKILKRDYMKELRINLLSEQGEVLSVVSFPKPKIKAIDFGSLLRVREDERELKIEIDFDQMIIDDIIFSF